MNTNTSKQHQDLLFLRKTRRLIYNTVDIDIKEVPNYRRVEAIEEAFRNHANYNLEVPIYKLLKRHYCSYSTIYWKVFLKCWLPRITNCVFLYTTRDMMPELFPKKDNNVIICGIMFYIRKPRVKEIYVRVICSNCFCGGKTIEHLLIKYMYDKQFDRISLNSDPSATEFYKKHGFVFTNKAYTNIFGVRYPYMIRKTGAVLQLDKDERVEDRYWPGIGFYVWNYWFL
jgi:hypothetical protein